MYFPPPLSQTNKKLLEFLISREYRSLELHTVLLAAIILRTTSLINNPFLCVQSRRVAWTKFCALLPFAH